MATCETLKLRSRSTPRTLLRGRNLFDDDDEMLRRWSTMTPTGRSPAARSSSNHGFDPYRSFSKKSSVLAKVKDKAKKWKHALARKMNPHHNSAADWSPRSLGSLEDYYDDDRGDDNYRAAPKYEFEKFLVTHKDGESPVGGPHARKDSPFGYPSRRLETEMKASQDPHGKHGDGAAKLMVIPILKSRISKENDPMILQDHEREKSVKLPPMQAIVEVVGPAYAVLSETTAKMARKIRGAAAGAADFVNRERESGNAMTTLSHLLTVKLVLVYAAICQFAAQAHEAISVAVTKIASKMSAASWPENYGSVNEYLKLNLMEGESDDAIAATATSRTTTGSGCTIPRKAKSKVTFIADRLPVSKNHCAAGEYIRMF